MGKIIIIADLGHVKAYKVSKDPMKLESTKIEPIGSYDFLEARSKSSDKFSDVVGRYRRGDVKKGVTAGYGEPHTIESESRKRLIEMIAKKINILVEKKTCKQLYLAATRKINNSLVEKLDPSVRSKIVKNLKADLTKIKRSDILSRFEE
jgi:hypothetical protein